MSSHFTVLYDASVFYPAPLRDLLMELATVSEHGFHFEYDKDYLQSLKAIPLGPEMPLTRRIYQSE